MTIQVTLFFTFVSILTLGEIAIGITSLPDSSTEFTISDGRILLEAHVSGNNVKSCKLSTDSKQIEKLLKSLPKTEQIGKKNALYHSPFSESLCTVGFFFQYFIFLKIAGTFCKNWQKMTLYNRVSYFFFFYRWICNPRDVRTLLKVHDLEKQERGRWQQIHDAICTGENGSTCRSRGFWDWHISRHQMVRAWERGRHLCRSRLLFFFVYSYIFAVWPHYILLKCQYLCEQIYIFCCSAELIFNDSRRFHFIF